MKVWAGYKCTDACVQETTLLLQDGPPAALGGVLGSGATAPAALGVSKALSRITIGLNMLFARALSGKSLRPLPGKKNTIIFHKGVRKVGPDLHEVTLLHTRSLCFSF